MERKQHAGPAGPDRDAHRGLLRAIRDETASREELRYWDQPFLDSGGAERPPIRIRMHRHDAWRMPRRDARVAN